MLPVRIELTTPLAKVMQPLFINGLVVFFSSIGTAFRGTSGRSFFKNQNQPRCSLSIFRRRGNQSSIAVLYASPNGMVPQYANPAIRLITLAALWLRGGWLRSREFCAVFHLED
jgi:hypothetical protein